MTEQVWIYMIGSIATFATALLGAVLAVYNQRISKRNEQHILEAKAGIVETRETMSTLEKNTNSKMDKLLKTTGEAEHAKGVLEGIAIPPAIGPAGPAGPPGPEGERGREGPRGEIGRAQRP
jgi:Na+-translocating ferredoxin:NAD+ oxidoreductase RnfG subunit